MIEEKGTMTKNQNTGHGHVYPRPDGITARCGGPGICTDCSVDAANAAKRVDLPRRIRIDKMTVAEVAIHVAKGEVEEAGADVLLTEAIMLLSQAQKKVADFVDIQATRKLPQKL